MDDTTVQGSKASKGMVRGVARVITNPANMDSLQEGEILVTYMTDPDYVPLMRRAGGIVTEIGGRLCHAAIVARELGVPAVVKLEGAMLLLNGKDITVNGDTGEVTIHG